MAKTAKRGATSVQFYTIGQLIDDMGEVDGHRDHAARQLAKVQGASQVISSYYVSTAQEYGEDARKLAEKIKGQPGVEKLRLRCEASGGVWSTQWLVEQRAKVCLMKRMEPADVQTMGITEFDSLLGKADKTDTKTDMYLSGGKITEAPPRVRATARYVREQLAEIRNGKRPKTTRSALIQEFFEQKKWSMNGLGAMKKSLQPTRHGWLLKVQPLKK